MTRLVNDPSKHWNLWQQTMDMGWVLRPVTERIGAFQQSVAKYPNIKPGEEFQCEVNDEKSTGLRR